MKTWYFSECPYPNLPDASEYDSIRVTLPNRYYDSKVGADLYNFYLDLWQQADELGLNVMTNEHHSTPTCLVPAVPLMGAILARITNKARILILGNPIANRRDPVRVAEEMAMIDNIARGRLEVGFVRGVPTEILPANSSPIDMSVRMWEAHDLILKAWESHDGPFNWEGSVHQRYVNIWPPPYQRPRPPVWITGTSITSAPPVAERDHTIATFVTGYDKTRDLFDSYRSTWKSAHAGGDESVLPDRLAYGVQIYVADSESAAYEGAEKLKWYFDANKVPPHLSVPPGYVPPSSLAAARTGAPPITGVTSPRGKSIEWAIENGVLFAGTPDAVVRQIEKFHERVGGFGHLLMMGHGGHLGYEETSRSLELYANEVAPQLELLPTSL